MKLKKLKNKKIHKKQFKYIFLSLKLFKKINIYILCLKNQKSKLRVKKKN
jgi:hypothetical protein